MDDQPSSPTASTKPRRRWFQFSLRTMIVVTAIFCILLATWIIPSERQRRACDEILRQGGLVDLQGFEFPNHRHGLYPKLSMIKWYHHYYYHVDRICIRKNPLIADWSIFPKLDTFSIHSDKLEELLQSNMRPEQIIHMSVQFDNALSSDWIHLITRYKNLESIHIYGMIHVRDENKLDGFLELPKLKYLSINQLIVLKPLNTSFQGAFDIVDKIKSDKPGSEIIVSYLNTK